MSQKQDRAIKFVDEVKSALTHTVPQKSRSDFAIKCEHVKDAFRKEPEAKYAATAKAFRAYITPLLKGAPEAKADEVKSALWKLDQAISGRK